MVGTQTLTTDSQDNVLVGTGTLSAGGSDITESGTTFSLEPEVTQVVAAGTSTTKIGSVIEPFVSAPPQYTGGAVNGVDLGGLRNVWIAIAMSAFTARI